MGIINRSLGESEQKIDWQCDVSPMVTSQTYVLAISPFGPAQLYGAQICATGLSGSPSVSLWIQRFVAGAGVTSINIGGSLTLQAFGTSGIQSMTMINSVTNVIQQGDLLMLSTSGSNTAAVQTQVTLTIRSLQDIKSHFGL